MKNEYLNKEEALGISACAEIVARGDPDRFLAAMSAPLWARARLLPLYAFNVEVARVPWRASEPMVAQMRLVWWREQIEALGKGEFTRGHEVLEPLYDLADEVHLSVPPMLALIEARHWDMGREGFADVDALLAHIDATAGGLMWLSAAALGASKEVEPAVRQVGLAQGIAAWLMAVPALQSAGRDPLPGRGSDATISELATRGLTARREAQRATFGDALPALRAAWRARALLKQAARDPSCVRDERLGQSEFMRRGGLLFRSVTGRW